MTASLAYQGPTYYRESGKFSPVRLLIAIGVSLVIMIVGAFVYAFCDLYDPLLYASVLLTLGYGFGGGYIVGRLLRWADVRSRIVRLFSATFIALASYAATWIFWIFALIGQRNGFADANDFLRDAWQVDGVWQLIVRINEVGVWSVGHHSSSDSAVSGLALLGVWLCEAAVIIYGIIKYAEKTGSARPYCESCSQWAKVGKQLVTTRPMDIPTLRSQLESGEFAPMLAQSPAAPADNTWLEIWTDSCNQCNNFNTLTVKESVRTYDKKGKPQIKSKTKINRLMLSTIDLQALQGVRDLQIAGQNIPAPAATPAKADVTESETEESED